MKNRHELREEFAKYGIDFVYNDSSRSCYLKLKGAPTFVEGDKAPGAGAHLTGWYHYPGGIKATQDVPTLAQRAKELYRKEYADNPQMLMYLTRAEADPFSNVFIFDDELTVQDELKHECIDGYLWATDTLVARLKEQICSRHSADELSTLENINFYGIYNMASGTMELHSTYWYMKENGNSFDEEHDIQQIPLSQLEATALKAAMELYCDKNYHMDCLTFLNEARAESQLPAIIPGQDPVNTKLSLDAQIRSAMSQLPPVTQDQGPQLTAPGR